jgi:outer membrane lipoprotein SlyB
MSQQRTRFITTGALAGLAIGGGAGFAYGNFGSTLIGAVAGAVIGIVIGLLVRIKPERNDQ